MFYSRRNLSAEQKSNHNRMKRRRGERFSQKLTPYPHIFFTENLFYGKVLWQSKLEKKFIDQILSYIRFSFEIRAYLGHLSQMILFKIWAKHKVKLYIYFVNQFLREKRHKRWRQECKQKQWLLLKFCNIFDLLISRTAKIAWWRPVFKFDFYAFSNNEQLRKEISWKRFYCIIPP